MEDGPWFVRLAGMQPIAEGGESAVFARPGKASQLIKVRTSRPRRTITPFQAAKNKLRRRFDIMLDRKLLQQHRAYLDAALRVESLRRPPPIPHVRGLLLTDLGLGIVVQKIRDAHGNPAPTVRQLVSSNLIDARLLQQLLTEFARDMSAFRIVGYDLNLGNLVYETRHGRSRIVLVDGFGLRTMIPVRRWSRRLNDRSLSRRFRIMAAKVGCVWDDDSWEFRAHEGERSHQDSSRSV